MSADLAKGVLWLRKVSLYEFPLLKFSEIEKFFQETIKNEKLSKKAQEHKQVILDKLNKLFEESPYLRVSLPDASKGLSSTLVA